jgi:signal transduction histidine kinase
LSVISLNAETIAEMSRDNITRTTAKTISRSVARIERLVNDLLDVARIESGTLAIVRRPHDIRDLLKEILLTYEPVFAARGLRFTVEIGEASLMAFFDHDRIVQVLSNLLGNAMKFTADPGAVTLTVHPEESSILFAVRDSGAGIVEAALPHVFERFWQIDANSRRGLGLGLHICQNIVQAHGGEIWAESEIGHGSTFSFTLPVR